MKGWDEG